MGICAKHDWSSFGPGECPGCVSNELQKRGLLTYPLQLTPEQEATLIAILTKERDDARTSLRMTRAEVDKERAEVDKSVATIRAMCSGLLSAMQDLVSMMPKEIQNRCAPLLAEMIRLSAPLDIHPGSSTKETA